MLIVYEIRLIAIREVSPPFGEERASTAVEQEISFPANKQRRQLWNSESLSSIHTILSKNIAFIHVFCFKSSNSMQYRSMLIFEPTYSKQYRPTDVAPQFMH